MMTRASRLERIHLTPEHSFRGVAAIVTDRGFRDSHEIAGYEFPAYHHRPASPTNLTVHQALDINVPIGCGDAPVFPGDVVVGDAEGVVVIPAELADEIANEAVEMTARGLRHRRSLQRAIDHRLVSRNRRADNQGLRRVAHGEGR